jgi:hypothetical protein
MRAYHIALPDGLGGKKMDVIVAANAASQAVSLVQQQIDGRRDPPRHRVKRMRASRRFGRPAIVCDERSKRVSRGLVGFASVSRPIVRDQRAPLRGRFRAVSN